MKQCVMDLVGLDVMNRCGDHSSQTYAPHDIPHLCTPDDAVLNTVVLHTVHTENGVPKLSAGRKKSRASTGGGQLPINVVI